MKYTPQVDNLVGQLAHVMAQLTNAYINYAVHSGQLPRPTTQEEIDKLGQKYMPQLAIAALAKSTIDPNGLFYDNEIIPFLEAITKDAQVEIEGYLETYVLHTQHQRPEGTPPPTKVEEEDPIIRAQQGKSSIIIPGVNDK